MKKIVMAMVLAMMLVFTGTAMAQVDNWHIANQATVGWNAVTLLDNGEPIPATDTVRYVVLMSNAITDPNKTNPVELGTTDALEYVITLNTEGRYLVGIKSERLVEGTKVAESTVAWSDDPAAVKDGKTFGLTYFRPPQAVGGIGPK
jgi:hypothetical protein